MTEKILITGNGLLANSLIKKFPNSECFLTYKEKKSVNSNLIFLDITNENELEEIFLHLRPDIIVHTAAVTNLDWSEKNQSDTLNVNAEATCKIKDLAKKMNSKLVFISTDSVFDGKKGNYTENEKVNPINIYSKSKVLAEKYVMDYEKSLIVRGTFFGLKNGAKESFFSYLLNELKNERKIRVPIDKISNGLFVEDFSQIISEMCKKELYGIYHIGSNDFENNVNFAKRLSEICNFDKELIEECFFEEIFKEKKLVAKRPLNTVLNTEKISKEIKMPTVEEVITSFSKNYKIMDESMNKVS